MSIIIEYSQTTGLGDQYTNIYSIYGIYQDLIKKTNSLVEVYSNSETSFYFGPNPPGLEYYSQIFNYSFIEDVLFFNKKIPTNFILKKNWSNIFKFYSDNLDDDYLLSNLDFTFYCHTHLSQATNSYNPLGIYPLINKNIIDSVHINPSDKFIVFHLRFADDWTYENNISIYNSLIDKIENISSSYPEHKIIIGGRGNFSDKLSNNRYTTKIEQYTNDRNKDIIGYAKDMVLFSYAEKIFTYCMWPSSFVTYAILHNKNNKHYSDFIENI